MKFWEKILSIKDNFLGEEDEISLEEAIELASKELDIPYSQAEIMIIDQIKKGNIQASGIRVDNNS